MALKTTIKNRIISQACC